MVHLYSSSVSHIFYFQNRNRFMVHAYQSANSLPESGNQVYIYTSRLSKKLFMKIF